MLLESRGMQKFFTEDVEYLPVACTIVVHHEKLLGRGTIWAFYPPRCHVESQLPVSPAMSVSLSSISLEHRE